MSIPAQTADLVAMLECLDLGTLLKPTTKRHFLPSWNMDGPEDAETPCGVQALNLRYVLHRVGYPGPLNKPPVHRDTVVVGVDPGIGGALALLVDGVLVDVRDMPVVEIKEGPDRLVFAKDGTPTRKHSIQHRVSAYLIANLIASWQEDWRGVDHVFVEKVHAHRDDSAASAFVFGRSTGEVVGVISALRLPFIELSPQRWKTRMGCNSDKKKSLQRAQSLFPAAARFFTRVRDDGRAEASLIGLCGYYGLCNR